MGHLEALYHISHVLDGAATISELAACYAVKKLCATSAIMLNEGVTYVCLTCNPLSTMSHMLQTTIEYKPIVMEKMATAISLQPSKRRIGE